MEHEVRAGMPVEIREEDGGIKVTGYAAVFNEEADIGGFFREVIAPAAFSATISAQDDVLFLVNHAGLPLARIRSNTLTLSEDQRGLKMETVLDPDDPDVQQILPKMRRGDLDKMSIAFRATKQEWDDTQDPPLRTIKEAQLYDVSVVNEPAYAGTEIAIRSLETHKKSQNFQAAQRRRRMKMHLALTERENG